MGGEERRHTSHRLMLRLMLDYGCSGWHLGTDHSLRPFCNVCAQVSADAWTGRTSLEVGAACKHQPRAHGFKMKKKKHT
jgi:hypothetical protein